MAFARSSTPMRQPIGGPPQKPDAESSMLARFARYVSLNVLGMVGVSCFILADTFFIANGVGADGLAALSFSIVLYTIMQATGLLLGIGGATKFQIYKSLGQDAQANRAFTHAVALALGAAVVYAAVVLCFSEPIAYGLGADAETVTLTTTYSATLFAFAPCFLLNTTLLPFVRNDGSPQLAMAAMLVGSLANIVLDYVFIFPVGWGMFGAAFATGISACLSLVLLFTHVLRRRNGFHLVRTRFSPTLAGSIAALGFSSAVVELSAGVVLFVFNLVLLYFEGNRGVAAYGIVVNIAMTANALFVGIAQGIQPLSSRCHARRDARGLRDVLRYALVTALVIGVALVLLVGFAAEPIAQAFNRDNDPHLTALAVDGLRIYFFGYLLAGINVVAAAFFSAVELPGRGLAITITRGFVVILGFVALFAWLWGMVGVWLTFPLTELVTACMTAAFLWNFLKTLKAADVR